jgi:hypothetical protein
LIESTHHYTGEIQLLESPAIECAFGEERFLRDEPGISRYVKLLDVPKLAKRVGDGFKTNSTVIVRCVDVFNGLGLAS